MTEISTVGLRPGSLTPFPSGTIGVVDERASYFQLSGFSGFDRDGRWTDGPRASISFTRSTSSGRDVILKFRAGAFAGRQFMSEQIVSVKVNGTLVEKWCIEDPTIRTRAVFVSREICRSDCVIDFDIPTCTRPSALGINNDSRLLGMFLSAISWEETEEKPPPESPLWQLGRCVGAEARKSFDHKIESGFWKRFVKGPNVLDVGFKGNGLGAAGVVPILQHAIGIDLDYPGYDGRTLPFESNTQDAVYSSHCLEHIPDFIGAIQEWYRVAKIGGSIIASVPSMQMYERRRRPPSRFNGSHVRFYTPASLLGEFEMALKPNSYRVRYLAENDAGYGYDVDPELPPAGCYEIELVVEKIAPPPWEMES
jgi:SAM-dependent methyltransferase